MITHAASGDPDVKALVYLAALAPDRGEVLGDLLKKPVAHPIAPLPLVSVNVTQPDGTKRAGLYLDPSKFRARFAADLPWGRSWSCGTDLTRSRAAADGWVSARHESVAVSRGGQGGRRWDGGVAGPAA